MHTDSVLLTPQFMPVYVTLVQWSALSWPSGGPFSLPLRVEDHSEFHSKPEAFGHMCPHCRVSDLGPFRLRILSAQMGNRTRAHGDESNPLEISMSSAMKGKPGLATGLTPLRALHPFNSMIVRSPKLVSSEDRTGARAPICFLLLYRGSSPFTHCATSAGKYKYYLPLRLPVWGGRGRGETAVCICISLCPNVTSLTWMPVFPRDDILDGSASAGSRWFHFWN